MARLKTNESAIIAWRGQSVGAISRISRVWRAAVYFKASKRNFVVVFNSYRGKQYGGILCDPACKIMRGIKSLNVTCRGIQPENKAINGKVLLHGTIILKISFHLSEFYFLTTYKMLLEISWNVSEENILFSILNFNKDTKFFWAVRLFFWKKAR